MYVVPGSLTKHTRNISNTCTWIQTEILEYVSAIVSLPIICCAGANPGGKNLSWHFSRAWRRAGISENRTQGSPKSQTHDLLIQIKNLGIRGSEPQKSVPCNVLCFFSLEESGRKWESSPEICRNRESNLGPWGFQLRVLQTIKPYKPSNKPSNNATKYNICYQI